MWAHLPFSHSPFWPYRCLRGPQSSLGTVCKLQGKEPLHEVG